MNTETIFREYQSADKVGRSDRSASDRARHRAKVKESLKDNLQDVIAEESLIGKSGDKKIKIPIRGLKEFRFVFGNNGKGSAQGNGNTQEGQVVGKNSDSGDGNGPGKGKAGDQQGEDIYETEITLDELTALLFEDLNLPHLIRKNLKDIPSIAHRKKDGFRRKGIQVRLDKRKTAINRVKRKVVSNKAGLKESCDVCDDTGYVDSINGKVTCPNCRVRFHTSDLRYKHFEIEERPESNAVMMCIMDTSGSMDSSKKFLARSLFYILYLFLRAKYRHMEVVFISHSTSAQEVDEDNFFHTGESGGTFISSGYEKALEIIQERYNPSLWNVYALHASDGDNFDSDNDRAVICINKLLEICNLFGYAEVGASDYSVPLSVTLTNIIHNKKFVINSLKNKNDIWPALKKYLSPEYEIPA
ncbi:MAG TPA: DUF444 family protein [Nitrosopumilaceae archaeon]|jgi:sporulation protein YhbH|nr:DUF444 family protein [Nitrosopumilaceae archaeon]